MNKPTGLQPGQGTPTSGPRRSPVELRNIGDWPRLQLAVAAGGRCEFPGCNRFLLSHHVTASKANFSEAAHIVAFREDGPRGDATERSGLANINAIENLMFLCRTCHIEIDTHPARYSVAELRRNKREHEARIHHLTSLGPEDASAVVRLVATVGSKAPTICDDAVLEALRPRYPASLPGLTIDLTAFRREDAAYFALARDEIDRHLDALLDPAKRASPARRFAVFALAPQALLMHLGHRLSDLYGVSVFQPHREPERTWRWDLTPSATPLQLEIQEPAETRGEVAVAFQVSGEVGVERIRAALRRDFSLWKVSVVGRPHNDVLRTADDLRHVRETCRELFRRLLARHGSQQCLQVFPAMPASAAVEVGRVHMPKADLPLEVYDEQRTNGGFVHALTIP